jgi:hypothetical protein
MVKNMGIMIKPPFLGQIEETMKDRNPDEYALVFNSKELAFIFKFQSVNGTIMESIHSSYIPEGQMIIIKKVDMEKPSLIYKPIIH